MAGGHDDAAPVGMGAQGVGSGLGGDGVEIGRGLVEQDQHGTPIKRAREPDKLRLARRQVHAARAHARVIGIRQGKDATVRARSLRGGEDGGRHFDGLFDGLCALGLRRLAAQARDVVGHRARE